MSKTLERLITWACLAVSFAYAAHKFQAVIGLWFHGIDYWTKLWRPFPDWGNAAQLYGALLAAKWNGTRSLWYGMLLLALIFFAMLYRKYKFLAFVLWEGALIEILNLFWIVNGKYRWGWSTPNTDSFILETALWVAGLLLCGVYLFKKQSSEGSEVCHVATNA
jgi:hypothetical protein